MNDNALDIVESPLYQGVNEQVAYRLTTTPWGSNPTSVSVIVEDHKGVDRTSTVTTGSAQVSGDVITLTIIRNLQRLEYTLRVRFTISGNVVEVVTTLIGQ